MVGLLGEFLFGVISISHFIHEENVLFTTLLKW